MAATQNGPVASNLTLLSDLANYTPGSKVRFLGCVVRYITKTATLVLKHNHPIENLVEAQVDIRLLVSTLGSDETQIGAWVNVIGYITNEQSTNPSSKLPIIHIQAVVLWSSGPFDLQAYERSLSQQANDTKILNPYE